MKWEYEKEMERLQARLQEAEAVLRYASEAWHGRANKVTAMVRVDAFLRPADSADDGYCESCDGDRCTAGPKCVALSDSAPANKLATQTVAANSAEAVCTTCDDKGYVPRNSPLHPFSDKRCPDCGGDKRTPL